MASLFKMAGYLSMNTGSVGHSPLCLHSHRMRRSTTHVAHFGIAYKLFEIRNSEPGVQADRRRSEPFEGTVEALRREERKTLDSG